MARNTRQTKLRLSALAFAVGLAFNGAAWGVLPTGAQVVSGSAQVGTTGSTMTVTNNPNAIINWQSFSIGQGEAVRFLQQSASSSVLNRVVGGQLSEIMGRLTSNGQVFLINPSGVLVGAGAVIDTASFFASTLQILDQDFLAGRLKFQGDATAGKIVNQGWIRTGFGGHVVLMAPKIENSGIIEAPGGKILLAAGQKITLTSLDLGDLSFEVQAPTDSVLNLGQLIADGGVVKVFGGSLRHSGDIRANSLTRDAAGEIVLKAGGDIELAAGSSTVANGRTGGAIRIESETGTARVAGNVSATGSSGAGGGIDVLGDKVVLTGNATLDASGATSGGVIRVGGDWQGANPDVRNAQSAFVGAGVTLKADATDQGNGGKIVVWSEGNTRFLGNLAAQGGPNGGNGGSAEVSGKGDLLFIGGANLGAPKGTAGNLLLDPLDLFVDTAGGLNPFIIDETTDFPANAVTVSPATLAGITGNVTLYASRDMRFNSAVTLAGAGQGLTAGTGRDLQIGAGITTNGGTVSLTATRNLTTFASSPIATSGGNVALTAQSISAGSMTVAAGAGVVTATTSAGGLTLGTILSSGSDTLTSSGGTLSLSNVTSTGAVALSSSSGIFANTIATGGGTLSAGAAGSSLSISAIDTRLGGGPTGGTVTLTSTPSSANTGNVQTGDANISLSGSSVSTGTLTTTGNVVLTATAGNISATIDNAANVTATSNRSISGTSINLSSNTTLNATSVSATAVNCNFSSSCPSATVNLSGNQGVNVGTVTASAPATTNRAAPFNSISESVFIDGGDGPVLAMSPTSQVTAANVTLQTNQGAGGGIGSAATPLMVNVERNFTFRPNGEFNVQLNGTGPNQLDIQIGVAATGQSYSTALAPSTLTKAGQITLSAFADDATVTVPNFAVTGGFNDLVFNSSPFVSLNVPNGNLVVTSASFPTGDQTGRVPPFCCPGNVIQTLPVSISASENLTVTNYTRSSGVRADSTSFSASAGSVTLGTITADGDAVTIEAGTDVTINTSLTTRGSVTVEAALDGPGNVTIDGLGIDTAAGGGTGSVNITVFDGDVRAGTDSVALEITAGGSISINARNIDTTGFDNPLDISGPFVFLTTNGAGTTIGHAGAPVIANTENLTINAGANFNVDTGPVDIRNLNVTATPSAVGNAGLAHVRSNGTDYDFVSDGSSFTLDNWNAPANQFSGGTLSFASTAGNIMLGNIDFSASNGGLSVTTLEPTTGNVTQTGTLDLGSGFLGIVADGVVSMQAFRAGGMDVSYATSGSYSGGCAGYFSFCGVASFTTNGGTITDPTNSGFFSITSRGAIATGVLDVGNLDFTSHSGGITTGTIGSAPNPAGTVTMNTRTFFVAGDIQTGAIEAQSVSFTSSGNINVGAINNSDVASGGATLFANGSIVAGNINAGVTSPGNIDLRADNSVTAGTLDGGSISIYGYNCCGIRPTITVGAVGSHVPGTSVDMFGSNVTIGGAVALDTNTSGFARLDGSALSVGGSVTAGNDSTIQLFSGGTTTVGPVTAGTNSSFTFSAGGGLTVGAITGGDGSSIDITSGGASSFQFTTIEAGPTGTVNVTASPGILQTLEGGNGGGITAGTVSLSASGAIQAQEGTNPVTPLFVRETGSLTIDSGGDMSIRLSGASGAPDLTLLNITRRQNDSTFILDNGVAGQLNANQTLNVADNGGGVNLGLGNTGTTPLAFTFRNLDSAGNIVVTGGIITKGGLATLTSDFGAITTGNINTTGAAGDGAITLSANSGIDVSGAVNAGGSSIYALTGGDISGAGSLTGAFVSATSVFGNIGTDAANRLAIDAPSVSLAATRSGAGAGGDVFATLTGTTGLTLRADNGFTVGTNASLDTLDLTTPGSATGAVSLSATNQTYTFDRTIPGTLGISAVTGTVLPGTVTIRASDGNLRVHGAGPFNAADLSLRAGYNESDGLASATSDLIFDGNGSALSVSNGTQNFKAGQDLRLEGNVTLAATSFQDIFANRDIVSQPGLTPTGAIAVTSGGTQNLSANRDILFQANSGSVTVSGVNQDIFANGNIKFLGGSNAGDSVSVSASGDQHIHSPSEFSFAPVVDVVLLGGTAANTSVIVSHTGSGNQTVESNRDILLDGGALGTTGVVAEIATTTGAQVVRAVRAVKLTGGAGTDAKARIHNDGTGSQQVGESDRFCCFSNFPYQTDDVILQGGSGTGSSAEITAGGQQKILAAFNTIQVRGGTGDGASALIRTTSTSAEQWIGFPFLDFCCGNSVGSIQILGGTGTNASATVDAAGLQRVQGGGVLQVFGNIGPGAFATLSASSQRIRFSGNVSAVAGTGQGANALIDQTGSGQQLLTSASLVMTGAGTAGANTATARIRSAGSQSFSTGTTILTAGVGPASIAEIVAATSQSLGFGNLTLTAVPLAGVSGTGSAAQIVAGTSQNLSSSTTALTGGSAAGAGALIKAANGQTLSGGGNLTLTGGTGAAGAGNDASALIQNVAGAQSISKSGTWAVNSGVDFAAAGVLNTGTTQFVSAGNMTIGTTAGANNAATFGQSLYSGIANAGSGAQTVQASSININNANAPGAIGIANVGAGQAVTASNGITVQVTGGSGQAGIANASGNQTLSNNNSTSGGMRIQVTGGTNGVAGIANNGGAQTVTMAFVDVNTGAVATGSTASLSASGDQSIHTLNGTAAGGSGSLRVAALGSGSATIVSGGNQLLEIDYPEQMQSGGRDGRITVGNGAALGNSRISAVNQDVFARSITVLGGAVAGANAKIDVSGVQNISLVSSSVSAAPAAGITVTGGAGGSALIDPVIQTILSNGAISVTGGSGTGTVGGIIGTGDQTVLVTSAGASSIAVGGGGGTNAFGQITTTGNIQRIGTSGGFTLTGGTGTNSDAIIGASGGTAETFVACGTGTCNFTAIPSVNNPFINSATDVGVYYNPITVPLVDIIAAVAPVPSAVESSLVAELPVSPFDSTVLVLWNPGLYAPVDEEERPEFLIGRRLPVCR